MSIQRVHAVAGNWTGWLRGASVGGVGGLGQRARGRGMTQKAEGRGWGGLASLEAARRRWRAASMARIQALGIRRRTRSKAMRFRLLRHAPEQPLSLRSRRTSCCRRRRSGESRRWASPRGRRAGAAGGEGAPSAPTHGVRADRRGAESALKLRGSALCGARGGRRGWVIAPRLCRSRGRCPPSRRGSEGSKRWLPRELQQGGEKTSPERPAIEDRHNGSDWLLGMSRRHSRRFMAVTKHLAPGELGRRQRRKHPGPAVRTHHRIPATAITTAVRTRSAAPRMRESNPTSCQRRYFVTSRAVGASAS